MSRDNNQSNNINHINKEKLNNLTTEIWKSAERLRGKFKSYEYQNIVLPMIVLRRIECVLLEARAKIEETIKKSKPSIQVQELQKEVSKREQNKISNLPFYNASPWTMRKIVEDDPTQIEKHFREYINGFSDNIQEIINKFNFRAVITQMVEKDRLFPILNQYASQPFGLSELSNLEMGYIYEELLRRFSEQSGEEAGEHFTPREVIRLMVELLDIPLPTHHISIYDPACGTGGMLSVAKEHLLEKAKTEAQKDSVQTFVTLHGQELQDHNYAICKSDMLIKGERDSAITCGNSLIPYSESAKDKGDQHYGQKFDFMLSNPPFGVTWGGKDGYAGDVKRLSSTRYSAGTPRSDDGALLFLQTMIEKIKAPDEGGSKIAIVFNGSPLSNGDCGSGESEIRRWILQNDWLDTIVMLPDQLFYNTGIFTYIWLLTNTKSADKKGKVKIIDARSEYEKEPKSFGNKRNRMNDTHMKNILNAYKNDKLCENCKLFDTTDFAYHKVCVVFWQTDEHEKPAYITEEFGVKLNNSNVKKKFDFYGDLEFDMSFELDGKKYAYKLKINAKSKPFETEVVNLIKADFAGLKEQKPKEVFDWFLSMKPTVNYIHRHYIEDNEYIPYGEDIEAFLTREIAKPIISWNDSPTLGYEILPNRYFYRYEAPKPATTILDEFWALEKEAEHILIEMGKELV